jgi:hypothetical protein
MTLNQARQLTDTITATTATCTAYYGRTQGHGQMSKSHLHQHTSQRDATPTNCPRIRLNRKRSRYLRMKRPGCATMPCAIVVPATMNFCPIVTLHGEQGPALLPLAKPSQAPVETMHAVHPLLIHVAALPSSLPSVWSAGPPPDLPPHDGGALVRADSCETRCMHDRP